MTKTKIHVYKWEDVPAATVKLAKDATSVRNRVQALGATCLKQYHDKPSDYLEVAKALTAVMNASPYHSHAFSVWVQMFTPFRVSEENGELFCHKDDKLQGKSYTKDGTKVEFVTLKAGVQTSTGFIAARDTMFWEVKPPKAPEPINDIEKLGKMVESLTKRASAPKDGDVIHMDMVQELKAIHEKWKAKEAA